MFRVPEGRGKRWTGDGSRERDLPAWFARLHREHTAKLMTRCAGSLPHKYAGIGLARPAVVFYRFVL